MYKSIPVLNSFLISDKPDMYNPSNGPLFKFFCYKRPKIIVGLLRDQKKGFDSLNKIKNLSGKKMTPT